MEIGAITGYIDVAQLVLYLFWIFFFRLVLYLHQEGKREGYPLESDRRGGVPIIGFPELPEPKTFKLINGRTVTVPHSNERDDLAIEPMARFPGAPMVPTGNPMVDGVGAASYAMREDTPDMTLEGEAKIVPLRAASDFSVDKGDPDPRGMTVVDAKGSPAGKVVDIWVDKSEMIFRYIEVEADANQARVLVPMTLLRVDAAAGKVKLASISHEHLGEAPKTKQPDTVTLLEEDKICGYFGGGHQFAFPDRSEALI
ncbi:MAG: photosynthetic reaction center subunit H [Burkholderiaceae bacterium]